MIESMQIIEKVKRRKLMWIAIPFLMKLKTCTKKRGKQKQESCRNEKNKYSMINTSMMLDPIILLVFFK